MEILILVITAIVHQTADEFEVGLGTITDATPDTLARTTVSSSNSDSAVDFSAGTKDVFVHYLQVNLYLETLQEMLVLEKQVLI